MGTLQTFAPTVTADLPADGVFLRSKLSVWHFSIIGAASIILALPMLIYGPMLQAHDGREHLNFSRDFSEQFWSGEWYPRWLIGMNHGLGSPTLFVYPPLPSYVRTFLEPLGRLCHFSAFDIAEFLVLLCSGICTLLWLSTIVTPNAAVTAVVLYMLMPYHLTVDYYRRAALSECWALVWMPLVVYFAVEVIGAKRWAGYCIGLAVAYALLILSHLVSALIFSLIPIAVAVTFSSAGQKLKGGLRVVEGMLLGAGLSCFYLVPALFHARYFPVSKLPLWSSLSSNLLTLGKLLHAKPGGELVHTITIIAVDMTLLSLICGVIVLVKGRSRSKKQVLFWLAISLVPGVLMSGLSAKIWEGIPLFFAAVQYPWRFNIILCLATTAIVAVFLSELPRLPRLGQAASLSVLAVAIVSCLIWYGGVWSDYRAQTPPPTPLVNEDDGWFPSWSPAGLDEASALEASKEPKIRFAEGNGTVKILSWRPRHIEFQTNSSTGGEVMINQFYYPEWRGVSTTSSRQLDIEAAMPQGLLELEVPAGLQQVSVDIPVGQAERVGCWVSLACLSGTFVMAFSQRWRRLGDSHIGKLTQNA